MKKTLRIGNYECVFDARKFNSPDQTSVIEKLFHPKIQGAPHPMDVSPLADKVRKADKLRQQGIKLNVGAPNYVEQTPEVKKIEAESAEAVRRYNNMKENERITGRHFFGTSVFYRTPSSYAGLKSWVFRNTSKEYSLSVMDMRQRTKIQNRYQRNEKDMQQKVSWAGQRGPGPTL